MDKKGYVVFISEALFLLWIGLYTSVLILFCLALIFKIVNPEINNLNTTNFLILGSVLFSLLLLNIRLIRKRKRKPNR